MALKLEDDVGLFKKRDKKLNIATSNKLGLEDDIDLFKERQKTLSENIGVAKDPKRSFLRTIVPETAKATLRGFEGIASGIGDMTRLLGEYIRELPAENEEIPFGGHFKKGKWIQEYKTVNAPDIIKNIFEKVGGKIAELGDVAGEFWRIESQKGIEAPDIELFEGTFMENPSFTRASAIVAEAIPSLAAATVMTIATKNPTVGAGFLGVLEGSGQGVEALEAGKDIDTAMGVATLSAVGTTLLEIVPLTRFMRGGAGKLGWDAFIGMAQEGTEEVLQTLWQNVIAKYGYDETRRLSEGMVEALIGGAGSGGVMGGFTSGRAVNMDNLIKEAKAKGVTDIEIEQMMEGVKNQIIANGGKIERTIIEHMKKTLKGKKGFAKFGMEEEAGEDKIKPTKPPEWEAIRTKEAMAYGESIKDDEAAIENLKTLARENQKTLEEAKKKEIPLDEEGLIVHKGQMIREAYEAAIGRDITSEEFRKEYEVTKPTEVAEEPLAERIKPDVSGETILREDIERMEHREQKTEKAKTTIVQGDAIHEVIKGTLKILRSDRDIPLVKTNEIIAELNAEAGTSFKNEAEIKDFEKNWKSEKKWLGRIIEEVEPELIKKKETTLLKERIRDIDRGIRAGKVHTKQEIKAIQEELIWRLKNSDLELKDKAKFISTIKNIQTQEQLTKTLPDIERRISAYETQSAKRRTINGIRKVLKRTKPRKQAGRPAGKYTPEIQQLLDIMRNEINLTQEEAEAKLLRNMEKYINEIPPVEIAFQNKILSIGYQTSQELSELFSEITMMVDTGVAGALLKGFARQEQREQDVSNAIDVISGGKGIPETKTTPIKEAGLLARLKTIGKALTSWDDILDILSFNDKASKPGESRLNQFGDVFDNEVAEKEGDRTQLESIRNIAKESYGYKTENQVVKKFQEDSKVETIGIFTNIEGQSVAIEMSRAEARKRWMELQDPTLSETFVEGMGYTQEIIDGINNFLTDQDKAFAKNQMVFYREYYNRVNDVFKEMYGINLPFNEFYSPIAREGLELAGLQGVTALLQEVQHRTSITTGSMKSRVANIKRISEQSDIFVLQRHIIDMEHFVAWADKIRELRGVFGDSRVKSAIKMYYGSNINKVIDDFIMDFTRGGIDRVKLAGNIEKYRIRFVRSVLSVKPSIGIKQLVSFLAYADAIPVADFTTGVIAFWGDPIGHTKTLLSSEYMKARGKNMTRDVQLAMKTDAYDNFRKNPSFLNCLMLNIQIGDQGAIVMGGWSVYRFHRRMGKSHKEAMRIFEQTTNDTQQSGDLSQLSEAQRGGTFARMITMFKSSQNQYFRKDLGAIRNLFAGRGTKTQHLKTLAIFHIILPSLFQYVANGFRWDEKEQLRAAILGSFNGAFLVGDALDSLIRGAMGMRQWDVQVPIMGITKDIQRMAKILGDDDITTEDIIRAMRGFMGVSGALTGLPLKQLLDAGMGMKELNEGMYEKGLKKALGWSPYIVDKSIKEDSDMGIWGETEKIKKSANVWLK